jgi:pantoate--beta-alanine ligase
MKSWSKLHRADGKTIGFVPTMGFLHEGHVSLMRQGRAENDLLVASIFVNPTQFGPNEDLSSYPRDPEADSVKCAEAGVDALFMPDPADMYGTDFQTYVEVQRVSAPLCGASRPGHFRGVATVVLKLINMVAPNAIYFGEKDFQQLQVIKTMVSDLDVDVTIVSCPTVRESDGLAMSSRNAYLSAVQRGQAVCLYQALLLAKERFQSGETHAKSYVEAMAGRIHQEPDAVPDYISLVDPDTLQDLDHVNNSALAVLAVRVGKTRLIDNMRFQRADSDRDSDRLAFRIPPCPL